ncbi:ATP-grasp domain-containing protein [Pseudonocardia sp. RS11V-5]|uniref:acetyl/propionyl/methylcrotonyl-CoA carboxylase subunit alpha n=1 Tax=Pseudonocardia terrae TaxID=2905831 RepID=UPI001E2B6879|nr:biotin carboxylase N-terminal domain-containing protein [Pseudonocardia terrae]MCE3554660.1 ATP-grasp domain-containing protein [Pseudonocardia terrae]
MRKVLVANRGEIAVRIVRTCAELGIASVAVHSDADAAALHVRLADEAVGLPGVAAADTYLDAGLLVDAALRSGADAVHPGYGFLAESAGFAAAVEKAGLVFVGPPASAVEVLGDKSRARALAEAVGVPVVPGSTEVSPEAVRALGAAVGWPLVVKAARGGGGRGMRVIPGPEQVEEAVTAARSEARAAFGDDTVHVERFLPAPRHVEVQVLADTHGTVLALGDRDCSVQRRHQKLVEEAPAPGLDAGVRSALADAAVRLAREAGYVGAGTVEFLVQDGEFWFLEANTRIQVEHPVTELVLGVDLVREQLRVAAGEALEEAGPTRGHAVECRINAEDPGAGFVPAPGRLSALSVPWGPGVRFDGGYEAGDTVPPDYDSLVGKLLAWGPTREIALHRLRGALARTVVAGVSTTVPAAVAVLGHPDFVRGGVPTSWFDAVVAPDLAGPAERPCPGPEPDDEAADAAVVVAGRRYRVPRPAGPGAVPVRRRTGSRASAPRRVVRTEGPDLVSPMRGTVTAVFVAPGDRVAAGRTLVTIEAMKMEHPLRAAADAVVEQVLVRAGDGVAPGVPVVRLRPDDRRP